MGKTRPPLRRAGSAVVLAAVLLSGCGDDESSTDVASGDDASEEISEAGSGTSGTGEPDDDQTAGEDDSEGEDASEAESADDAGEDVETLEVTIADGGVSPPFDTYEVALGADVRIEITSDVADELHLHGYDLELELEPGEPGVLEFTADIEGRFELETHDLGLQLLQLEVG